MSTLTPKENYLRVLRGEIPDFVPSFYEPYADTIWLDYYFKPTYAPDGFNFSPWGVRYVGSPDLNMGGIPEPNFIILRDITKWRDVIKNPGTGNIDFEKYYTKSIEGRDRENQALVVAGGEYFQTLVSFMGFAEAVMAMFEEPDEVYALLDYISEYNIEIAKQRIRYTKPDIYMVSDDCAAAMHPFFSPDMYKRLIKPFHKKHADLARENNLCITKHDCGHAEAFIPDWIEMGVSGWNPAQAVNDLRAIKQTYGAKFTPDGGQWEYISRDFDLTTDDGLIAAVDEYVAAFAPGGGFVFSAMPPFDPQHMEDFGRRNELVRNYFFDKIRNYYN
ncbi:MAG: veratrol--corrinoid protein metyltransferase [Oscillospiraceae bacterium]|jgi:hypothetical protein|nr:veratrol--corrinoid protein metyltransferase [Oscillospiraceae bacterium]